MIYIILGVVVIIIVYFIYEDYVLDVSKYKVINKRIPKEFNNFKIAHISDFHSTRKMYTIKKLIEKIVSEKVDIVVITGDLFDERIKSRKGVIFFIDNIPKNIPIYFTPGNHETKCLYYKEALEELVKKGVHVLNKDVNKIKIGDSFINLIGLYDSSFEDGHDLFGVIDRNLKKLKFNKNLYSILLCHRPDFFDLYVKYNLDLALVGHAHGGQWIFPFIGSIYAPDQGMFPKLTRGVHKRGNTTMVISRGVGNSGFPIRINNKPELVIVTLNKEE